MQVNTTSTIHIHIYTYAYKYTYMLIERERLIDTYIGAQPEVFQGRGGFVRLGHFHKHFIKKSRKKAPQGSILEFFLLDTLKTTF